MASLLCWKSRDSISFLPPLVYADTQRAYRRRLRRLGPKRNGKDILVAGGKAAAAVFASVLGVGGGGVGDGTNQVARLTGTARTTLLESTGIARLTGTAAGLALSGVSRSTLVLKTVSRLRACSNRGVREPRKRSRMKSRWVHRGFCRTGHPRSCGSQRVGSKGLRDGFCHLFCVPSGPTTVTARRYRPLAQRGLLWTLVGARIRPKFATCFETSRSLGAPERFESRISPWSVLFQHVRTRAT